MDGLKQGYNNCLKEIREYFDKYLDYYAKDGIDCYKKDGTLKAIYEKKLAEFDRLMEGKANKNGKTNNSSN